MRVGKNLMTFVVFLIACVGVRMVWLFSMSTTHCAFSSTSGKSKREREREGGRERGH